MKFDIITIYPDFFYSPLSTAIIGRAVEHGRLEFNVHNLRDYSGNKHRKVDDTPFGGGAGMVMTPGPWQRALTEIKTKNQGPVIYFTPRGKKLTQARVEKFAKQPELILMCGRFEGIDQRIIDTFVDEEICIGDYVLSGGESASLVFIESVTRFVPGVLKNEESVKEESFSPHLGRSCREYPLYTQPRVFEGKEVPEILLSGNHREIEKWRRKNCK